MEEWLEGMEEGVGKNGDGRGQKFKVMLLGKKNIYIYDVVYISLILYSDELIFDEIVEIYHGRENETMTSNKLFSHEMNPENIYWP